MGIDQIREIAEKYIEFPTDVGSDKRNFEWEKKLYSIMKKVRLKFAKQTWVCSIPSRRQEGIMMKKKIEKDSKSEM